MLVIHLVWNEYSPNMQLFTKYLFWGVAVRRNLKYLTQRMCKTAFWFHLVKPLLRKSLRSCAFIQSQTPYYYESFPESVLIWILNEIIGKHRLHLTSIGLKMSIHIHIGLQIQKLHYCRLAQNYYSVQYFILL